MQSTHDPEIGVGRNARPLAQETPPASWVHECAVAIEDFLAPEIGEEASAALTPYSPAWQDALDGSLGIHHVSES